MANALHLLVPDLNRLDDGETPEEEIDLRAHGLDEEMEMEVELKPAKVGRNEDTADLLTSLADSVKETRLSLLPKVLVLS